MFDNHPEPKGAARGRGMVIKHKSMAIPWYNYFISYLIGRQNPVAKKLSNVDKEAVFNGVSRFQ